MLLVTYSDQLTALAEQVWARGFRIASHSQQARVRGIQKMWACRKVAFEEQASGLAAAHADSKGDLGNMIANLTYKLTNIAVHPMYNCLT